MTLPRLQHHRHVPSRHAIARTPQVEPPRPAADASQYVRLERPQVALDSVLADRTFEGLPAVRGLGAQALSKPAAPPPDLSQAKVFGRPVDPGSTHDLFWHYFGGRAAPTNNEQARAMMAEMAEKLALHGFKVEPIEHERMDKVRITSSDGRVEQVDFIYAMGGAEGQQRLQWLPSNPVGPTASGGEVDAAFVQGILSQFPPTNDGMRRAIAEINKHRGYETARVLEHPLRLDKIEFGNGQVVDVIVGAGGSDPRWGWLPE